MTENHDRQLTRTLYSAWDFQQSLSALTFLLEECEYEERYSKVELRRFRSFESTAIISFARPFEASRGRTAFSLKTVGIELSKTQKQLMKKLLYLRRKIIAHSDEEEMHFRVSTFDVLDGQFNVARLQYDESLNLELEEVRQFQELLSVLLHGISSWMFRLAQEKPQQLNVYKKPNRMK